MASYKSAYPAYDKARTAFNRHLRARRDIIQTRYDQHFEVIKSNHRKRFEEANAALLQTSETKMSGLGNELSGPDEMNAFFDANNGLVCSGNMTDAWNAARVEVVIGIDSDSEQSGTARVVADLTDRPDYDVPFAIRGDPVKDDAIMFSEDVDDHLRHGLARVVMGHSLQAMKLGRDAPASWHVPENHLHPKVGYLWAVLHHPLHAHRIHTAAAMLRETHRRGCPTGLLGLTAVELLTPGTVELLGMMGSDHHDDLVMRDSAMLHAEYGPDGVEWKRNTPYSFRRGKVDRNTRSRTWSQMEIPVGMPETVAIAAAGRSLGELVEVPSCGDARTDEAVAAMTISQVTNDGRGGAVITLDATAHIPLVPPPAGIGGVLSGFAPVS